MHYTNIKRELLAIMYGCEKFHTYLYGRTFTVETDHKLLEMISMKNLIAVPARLQRMLLWLQQYDMIITYRPDKEMLLADAISHLLSRTDIQTHFSFHKELPDQDCSRNTMRSHLVNSPQIDIEWLAWQMHKCSQNCQKLLEFPWQTLKRGWSTHKRWTGGHPTILQRLYHGWSPQKSCRNQQGIGLG